MTVASYLPQNHSDTTASLPLSADSDPCAHAHTAPSIPPADAQECDTPPVSPPHAVPLCTKSVAQAGGGGVEEVSEQVAGLAVKSSRCWWPQPVQTSRVKPAARLPQRLKA
jgi:hypothetical protein